MKDIIVIIMKRDRMHVFENYFVGKSKRSTQNTILVGTFRAQPFFSHCFGYKVMDTAHVNYDVDIRHTHRHRTLSLSLSLSRNTHRHPQMVKRNVQK